MLMSNLPPSWSRCSTEMGKRLLPEIKARAMRYECASEEVLSMILGGDWQVSNLNCGLQGSASSDLDLVISQACYETLDEILTSARGALPSNTVVEIFTAVVNQLEIHAGKCQQPQDKVAASRAYHSMIKSLITLVNVVRSKIVSTVGKEDTKGPNLHSDQKAVLCSIEYKAHLKEV